MVLVLSTLSDSVLYLYQLLSKYLIRFQSRTGWLDGCFGFSGPLRQYFSLYRAVSQREDERGEKG